MRPFRWKPVAALDPERLEMARLQLQSALQWLARIERSFANGASGDVVALRWSDERDAVATHRFADGLEVELRIDDLVMQFTEHGAPSNHELDVEEHTPAHVEAWILIELLHRGVDRDRFSKELPYDVSGMMKGDAVEFSPGAYRDELRALGDWFRGAASAIREASRSPDAGPDGLAVSPRELSVEARRDGRTLGFSLGSTRDDEPYFYVAEGTGRALRARLMASDVPDQGASEAVHAFFAEAFGPTRH